MFIGLLRKGERNMANNMRKMYTEKQISDIVNQGIESGAISVPQIEYLRIETSYNSGNRLVITPTTPDELRLVEILKLVVTQQYDKIPRLLFIEVDFNTFACCGLASYSSFYDDSYSEISLRCSKAFDGNEYFVVFEWDDDNEILYSKADSLL